MSFELASIDALLNKARQRREQEKAQNIDQEIEAVQLSIESNRRDEQRLKEELKGYMIAKGAVDGRLVEMQDLKQYFESELEYEKTRQELTQSSFDAEAEIEDLDKKMKEMQAAIATSEREISALRIKKDQIVAALPTTPKDRVTIPTNVITPILAKEKQDDEKLAAQAKACGLVNKTRGLRMAIFGGLPGRQSAQAVHRFVERVLEVQRLEWYASESNNNKEAQGLLTSLKNGGTHAVILFDHVAGPQGYNIKDMCKQHGIPCAVCAKIGKASVLQEVARAFNIMADTFAVA